MAVPLSPEILNATILDVRTIASMLRALSFRPTAVVEIREAGIKFTVEEGRSVQANAYLEAHAFESYTFSLVPPRPTTDDDDPFNVRATDDEPVAIFGVSIATVLECLNIFGNAGTTREWGKDDHRDRDREDAGRMGRRSRDDEDWGAADPGPTTTLEMSYRGEGHPLVLLLEESGIVTRCEITTYEPDELMELYFDDHERVMKFIMKSEWLRDALSELDPSSERVSFSFSPTDHASRAPSNRYTAATAEEESSQTSAPLFRLESVGNLGSTEMDYPNDRDVLETFECAGPIRNSYKYSQIQRIQKALSASIKTSLRTATDGLMSFQFMIPIGMRTHKAPLDKFAFVEFLCVALEEEY